MISRETILLTYDKNFILTILQLRGKSVVLGDGMTQIEFDIQNLSSCIEILSTSTIYPTLTSPPDLQYLLFDIKNPNEISLMIRFTWKYQVIYLELIQSPQNSSLCTERYSICHLNYTIGK